MRSHKSASDFMVVYVHVNQTYSLIVTTVYSGEYLLKLFLFGTRKILKINFNIIIVCPHENNTLAY